MFFIDNHGVTTAKFDLFLNQDRILHFVSTREGGVSKGPFESLNLSLLNSEDDGMENRKRLARSLEIPLEKLVFPFQCHSNQVKIVDAHTKKEDLVNIDALITASSGVCIGVLVADCVPIILYDKKNHVAGVVHAGWRGTVSLVVTKAIKKMIETFGTEPSNILAGIGPSISVKNYEVGEEGIEKVENVFFNQKGLIKSSEKIGKGYFDLWKANELQLLNCGLHPENIEIAEICTFDHSEIFFSARRLGPRSGRFGAGILLR